MNFADAASRHPNFAKALPWFVSEVRRMFTADEIASHLALIEHRQNQNDIVDAQDDELFCDEPAAAEHVEQFMLIKELLTATALGTSLSTRSDASKPFGRPSRTKDSMAVEPPIADLVRDAATDAMGQQGTSALFHAHSQSV